MKTELDQAGQKTPTEVEVETEVRVGVEGEAPSPPISEPPIRPAKVAAPSQVCSGNLVVEGVLSGFQGYALRPVPATGYAARRLRARSFRTAALGEIIARRVAQSLGLTPLAAAGARFLLAGPAAAGWEQLLLSLQREIDAWLFQNLQPAGELECHLAGAICPSDHLPLEELAARQARRRLQPLEGALRAGLRWNTRAFVLPAVPPLGLCSGCAAAAPVRRFGDESLCDACAAEGEAGEHLPGVDRAWFCPAPEADLAGPGLGLRFTAPAGEAGQALRLDTGRWWLLRRLPALCFEELAERSPGRKKLLGYLRIRMDVVARAREALEGDPAKTLALREMRDGFFGEHLRELLESSFPLVYPVLGEEEEALFIGPWQETLDLAVRLGRDSGALLADSLSLAAGFAPAPTCAHLAAASGQAAEQLQAAREAGGKRIHALGASIEWERAASLLSTGKNLGEWLERRSISQAWLDGLAHLRAFSNNGDLRWRARLESLVREPRIKHRQAREWAARLPRTADAADSDWSWMEFLARYASLVGGA